MRGIMAARTKALEVVAVENGASSTSVNNYEMPPAKSACKFVDPANAAELITLLHQEAKVI